MLLLWQVGQIYEKVLCVEMRNIIQCLLGKADREAVVVARCVIDFTTSSSALAGLQTRPGCNSG